MGGGGVAADEKKYSLNNKNQIRLNDLSSVSTPCKCRDGIQAQRYGDDGWLMANRQTHAHISQEPSHHCYHINSTCIRAGALSKSNCVLWICAHVS